MEKQYIQMMLESLQKKEEVVKNLIVGSEKQKDVLSAEEVDWDAFDALTVEKGNLIDELLQLDEGLRTYLNGLKNL